MKRKVYIIAAAVLLIAVIFVQVRNSHTKNLVKLFEESRQICRKKGMYNDNLDDGRISPKTVPLESRD